MKKCVVVAILLSVVQICFGQQQQFRTGIFLHHSTGYRIWGPNDSPTSVPLEIDRYNLAHALTGSNAVSLAEQHWPPAADNEWTRWHAIFDNASPDGDIRPILAANPIIMIKSCFPSSQLWGEMGSPADTVTPAVKSIYNDKWHWRHFVRAMEKLPNNFFVIWTNAPLAPGVTTPAQAAFADKFCRWAKDTLARGLDPVFGPFPKNVYVFDFFHKLAGADGILPLQYATDAGDSHPNGAATRLVAPQLVQETFDAALAYEHTVPVIEQRAPVLTLAPATLILHTTKLGLTRDTAVTISNTGNDTLRISGITSTNPSFRIWPTTAVILPCASVRDSIRFAPSQIGWATGKFFIASNDSTSPDTVSVSGLSFGAPAAGVAPGTIQFGAVKLGLFKDTILTIMNTGTDTLRVSSIAASAGVFTARPPAASIAPGAMVRDTLRFTPFAIGTATGKFIIASNDASGPDTVLVSGSGTGTPVLVVGTPSLHFGTVKVGQLKDTTFTISNAGNDTLKISSIMSTAGSFIAHPAAMRLAPGTSVTDTVMINPLRFGSFADSLFLRSDGGSVLIPLSAESPHPRMDISSASIDFGTIRRDSTATKRIVVTNASINALRIDSLKTRTKYFLTLPLAAPIVVTTEDSAFIVVSFTPDSAGSFLDTLSVFSNQERLIVALPLAGIAQPLTSAPLMPDRHPLTYELESNYPNPFNPSTTFRYGLPRTSRVKLQIFNVLGQHVADLVNGERPAGWHRATWYADAPTGIYFYRLEAAGVDAPDVRFVQVRKMLLVK